MAKVIVAPENITSTNKTDPVLDLWDYYSIFLAGGITGCDNWQKVVQFELMRTFKNDPLLILNPRRDNFPINNPNAAEEQITWEFNALDYCDMFTMYFAGGSSDQPICMYEYGRHLAKFDEHSRSLNSVVVTACKDYKRYNDVIIQTRLVDDRIVVNSTLDEHIDAIVDRLNKVFRK